MITQSIVDGPDVEGPAEYRILVQGRLDERWRDRLGGLAMAILEGPGQAMQTELTGLLPDQAALMGILQHLYARGVAIVRVERANTRKETGP